MNQSKKSTQNNHSKKLPTKRDSEKESLLHSKHHVLIEKMAIGGAGVSRLQFGDQKIVCFVDRATPQDELEIEITNVEKNYLKARILQVVNPGPSRRKAPCIYFENCGGCAWQNIQEAEQRQQKELLLKELFKKFLPTHAYTLIETQFSEHAFEYRNRIQLKQLGKQLGYFKPESHELVDINDCLIAEAPLRNWLKTEKLKLRASDKLKKHELKVNEKNQVEFYGIGQKSEGLSFSQVNRFVNEKLVNAAVTLVEQAQPSFVTEFYAGSGNFTFALQNRLSQIKIDAVELNPELTAHAVKLIQEKKLHKQITFYTTKAELFPLRNTVSSEYVFVDPPRNGCDPLLLDSLLQQNLKKLLYISCHPVSLVRDLQYLAKKGLHFKISHLQIFDMFPQTDHFETLCLIEKI